MGVALLFSSQVANTSLNGSVDQLTSGLVGQSRLQLAAPGPEGFPERLLGEVQRLPGVRAAAPVLETQANVVGPNGARSVDLIGADPQFVRFGGPLLRHFSAAALARQRALALPLPVAEQIGASSLQVINLRIGASTIPALLGITLQENAIGQLAHSPVALAPLAYAQKLAGMTGRLSRIFVQSVPGHEWQVRAALVTLAAGRINVEPANYDATLFESAAAPTDQSTSLFAAISALVGFLFAFNAMLLTVPARRALITDLQLDGYSPAAVIQVLLFDAAVLGVCSCLLGLALGDELSLHLFHANPGYLSFAFAVGSQRIVDWQSVAIGVAGGMLASLIGVLTPLYDIFPGRASGKPQRARTERQWSRAMLAGGLACLAMTTAIIVLAPQAAVAGVIALTCALLLLLPVLLRSVLLITERLTDNVKAKAPLVAVGELRSTWTRTVGIAATGAVAVFGSVSIQGAHADLQRGLDRSARDVSRSAELWVFPPGPSNLLATAAFPSSALPRLAHLPGVRSAWIYRGGFLDFGDRRVWVSAQPTAQPEMVFPHQLVQGNLTSANERVRRGGWAVISKSIANTYHLRIGGSFTLPAPHPTSFRVAALSTNVGWPPGAIILNASDYARAWESQQASAYEIMTTPGASATVVAREIEHTLGPTSGLQVQTGAQREAQQRAASRQGLQRLSQISTLVLIAAVLAMAAAMGSMIWQRRARLAGLKLDGFSDLAVWRALLFESVMIVGSGCLIGALFGLYGQLLGSSAILTVTGFPVVFSLGFTLALGSLALVT
ncbi:MAG TPA: FtsX-like permease family protein, partial [Solirubrobacteraceae bacterium]|nr:FtsX-like permease family protein [Solirubrobacteraceae bacterium]